ncbi:DNA-binding domain-containing protein [Myxococcaceae bacterium GXIMD 01537]
MKPGLRRFFDSMEAYLTGPGDLESLYAAHPGWDASAARVALYAGFAGNTARDVLRQLFPLMRKRLGEEAWGPLVEAFRATRPARSFEINRLGEGFPDFLAREVEPRGLPAWAPALARFEWADFEVFSSPEEVPARVERLTVNPTLQVLQLGFRVCACARVKAEAPPEPGDEMALLWRHPVRLVTMYLEASAPSLLAVKMAVEGLAPAEVAAATGVSEADIQRAVASSAEDGLVLVP